MRFVCRNQTCQKQFSTKFNRNKHERIKGHFEESKQATCKVPHDPSTNLYSCPRIDCKTTSKYKQNILKHLKSCSQVNLNKATAKENRTCGICKTFAKKSNRDRHIQSVHHDDIFFNDSESITNYLAMKKTEFSCANLPAWSIITKRNLPHIPKEIKDCMKQHMMIYKSGEEVVLKEYICECDPCRRFDFEECENDSKEEHSEVEIDDYFADEELDSNQDEQIFDFIEIPSFVTLFTGVSSEPLYFVKIVSKGIADERLSDSWGHLILPKSRYFTCHYLKLARSRNILTKKFDLIPLTVYITPDEIYDLYIETDENLFLDSKIYDAFMQKAKI